MAKKTKKAKKAGNRVQVQAVSAPVEVKVDEKPEAQAPKTGAPPARSRPCPKCGKDMRLVNSRGGVNNYSCRRVGCYHNKNYAELT